MMLTEDEVDTRELLKGLKKTASQQTLAERTLEAIRICGLAEGHLIGMISLNFI